MNMLTTRLTATFLLATALSTLAATAAAGVVEISDDINARIARAKGQQATVAVDRGRDAAGGANTLTSNGLTAIGNAGGVAGAAGAGRAAGCNIAIGNVFEDRAVRGGVSTSARRETTVIVTGDVIQVGNNCR